jgi:putative ABC transport system permease protein
MEIAPIFASLRRNPLGPVLIVLQVALTLAILLNVAGIVQQHLERMHSISGVDEANVFTLLNRWVVQRTYAEAPALVARDLAVLRATPGVQAAVATNGIPLSQRGWGSTIDTKPVDPTRIGGLTRVQLYYFDEQGAQALGLRMKQGRWFTADEVASAGQPGSSSLIIVTQALADHVFPKGGALGKVVYMQDARADTIVGIVENLQTSSPGNPAVPIENGQYSVIMPSRFSQPVVNSYVVRTQPGAMQAAMKEVERRLREADPLRVITQFKTFAETRKDAYRANRALTAILVAVNLLLIAVTALGIAGLAAYWVAQRQRMIGVRRALGAKRADILAYFHSENLLIVGVGVLLGVGLAVALNSLLVKAGVPPIGKLWLAGGVLVVLAIGQLAVLLPARRAARIPPALAMRSG